VGVDVERHTPVAPATIAAVLCPEERSAHARLAPDAAASYFFSRWTLKESLVKATGEGLRAALDAIHCVERGGCFDFPGWAPFRGWRCPLEDGYSLAVCHRGGEPPAGVRRVSFDALCG
jgi:4'-phosphopantetheinyl transferase